LKENRGSDCHAAPSAAGDRGYAPDPISKKEKEKSDGKALSFLSQINL
jgi:hypothetical protein